MELGSAVYRPPSVAPSLMVAGTNTSTIQQSVLVPQVITPSIIPTVPIV